MHGKPTKQIVRNLFSATDGAGASQHFWRSLRSVGGFGRQSVVGQSLQTGDRRVLLENCPGVAAVSGRPGKHRGESLPWSEWHQSELPRDPVPTS